MKGRAFVIVFALAALVIGCSKSAPTEATTTTGTNSPSSTGSEPQSTSAINELKIETLKPGKGKGANEGDMLTMLYRGKLASGMVFDSNMEEDFKPAPGKDPFSLVLGMGMVIPGWDKGLVGIKVGECRKLSIPSKLGYGDKGSGQIPPNADLIFTVTCLDIVPKGEEMIIDTTDIKKGTGAPVKKGDKVTIHYVGTLLNDKQFDSSREKKTPFSFTVGAGEVVPGFDKGVMGMQKGGLRKLRIPPQAAYGADPTGGIPGNSVLIFEIELLQINGK